MLQFAQGRKCSGPLGCFGRYFGDTVRRGVLGVDGDVLFALWAVDLLDHQEDGERDDQEVEQGVQEQIDQQKFFARGVIVIFP